MNNTQKLKFNKKININCQKKYLILQREKALQSFWKEKGINKFDVNSKLPIYSIDTRQPTVSGKIHIGHI